MEAFFVSALAVAIGEIGDKTQLLAFVLASRFRKPVPIVLGILVATLANHGLAGVVGNWVRSLVEPDVLRWGLAASFLGMAVWVAKPDKLDEAPGSWGSCGVFMASLTAFFFAEMGDKTQLATVALAASYPSLAAVVAGTTFGMLCANVPVVLLAERAAARIPFKAVRYAAAGLFAVFGVVMLLGVRLV